MAGRWGTVARFHMSRHHNGEPIKGCNVDGARAYWSATHSLEEAAYVTAVLNTRMVLDRVKELQPVGQFHEQIAQTGIGFDAVHLAGADEAGEAGPVPAALVVTSKERVTAVHGRAADGVFDEIGFDIDAAVIQEPRVR